MGTNIQPRVRGWYRGHGFRWVLIAQPEKVPLTAEHDRISVDFGLALQPDTIHCHGRNMGGAG